MQKNQNPVAQLTEALENARKLFGELIPISPVKVDLGWGKEEIVAITATNKNSYYNNDTLHHITAYIHKNDEITALTRSVRDAIADRLRAETADTAVKHIKEGDCLTELNEKFNEYYDAIRSPGVVISEESEKGHREILAQKVAIDCIPRLSKEQLARLDQELEKVVADKGLRRAFTVDYLTSHPVKEISVIPSKEDPNHVTVKIQGVIPNDHTLEVNNGIIVGGQLNFWHGEKTDLDYLAGHSLEEQLGTGLSAQILNTKEPQTISFPKTGNEGDLLNDYYSEQVAIYAEEAKEAIRDRVTEPYAREFTEEQEQAIIIPGMRLTAEERTTLLEDLWVHSEKDMPEEDIPEKWMKSAHEELMDLARNGQGQHQEHGLSR